MIFVAKTIAENNKVLAQWEFEMECDWDAFVRSTKNSDMITDYYKFDKIDENGVMIFIGKYRDDENGILTRTYQIKH